MMSYFFFIPLDSINEPNETAQSEVIVGSLECLSGPVLRPFLAHYLSVLNGLLSKRRWVGRGGDFAKMLAVQFWVDCCSVVMW